MSWDLETSAHPGFSLLDHPNPGRACVREEGVALVAIRGMDSVTEGESDSHRLVQFLVLGDGVRYRTSQLEDAFTRHATRLGHEYREFIAPEPCKNVEISQMTSHRFREALDDAPDVRCAGFGTDFFAVLEATDAHRKRVFSACCTGDLFMKTLPEICLVREARLLIEVAMLLILLMRERVVDGSFDVGNEPTEGLQVLVIEAARKEAIECDLVVDGNRTDDFSSPLQRSGQDGSHVQRELREGRIRRSVADQMR